MGRTYAGVLGPVAFCTVLFRGLFAGSNVESTMLSASLFLFAFAAIGHVVGQIAEATIYQSVVAKCNAELDAVESQEKS